VNRALRHDALLVWRETAAALAGWGDRVLVAIGVALAIAATRHASHDMAMLAVKVAALSIAGWIGFGVGRVIEERLVLHRDAYLFAEDVLTRTGAWRYRLAAMAIPAVAMTGVAAIIDARTVAVAAAGLVGGFLVAIAGGALKPRSGVVRSVTIRRWRDWTGGVMVAATATLPIWWTAALAWIVVVPVLVIAVVAVPNDAEVARFEAVVGRSADATLEAVRPMVWWSATVVLAATLAQGPAAGAIGAAATAVVVWLGLLRVLAWRWVGRRSGEVIVLAVVAGSAIVGALAMVLAPVALAIATIWLWRRSQAARWLIA